MSSPAASDRPGARGHAYRGYSGWWTVFRELLFYFGILGVNLVAWAAVWGLMFLILQRPTQ